MTFILQALLTVGKRYFVTFASEKFLEWMMMWAAETITESTKTTKDDKWLAEFKEQYKKGKHS